MNTPQPLTEPPLKNVSTKPPEPDRGSADTEKRFVPSTWGINPQVHHTLQPEDPLARCCMSWNFSSTRGYSFARTWSIQDSSSIIVRREIEVTLKRSFRSWFIPLSVCPIQHVTLPVSFWFCLVSFGLVWGFFVRFFLKANTLSTHLKHSRMSSTVRINVQRFLPQYKYSQRHFSKYEASPLPWLCTLQEVFSFSLLILLRRNEAFLRNRNCPSGAIKP